MSFHRSDDDQHDALNDYLDAFVRTDTPDDGQRHLDPDLRQTVDRFLARASDAGMVTGKDRSTRRTSMHALAAPGGTPEQTRPTPGPWYNPHSWRQAMPAVSTAALIIGVIALTFSIFGPTGLGGDGNGDPGHFAAAPVATADPDDLSTTRPHPGANECAVEPMTREEIIDHVQQANTATFQRRPQYENPIQPTEEQRDAILQTFNSWLACGLSTPTTGPAYQLRIQTPWYTAGNLPIFGYGYTPDVDLRPISDEAIVEYVDAVLDGEARETATPGVAASPPATRVFATPEWAPMPVDATPVARNTGASFPVLFADDITITGPETASAQVVFVNEVTHEVATYSSYQARFVLMDGHWLLDSYTETGKG